MIRLVTGVLTAFITVTGCSGESYFDAANGFVRCAEPIPDFALVQESIPSNSEVKKLCSCIWSSFPDNGWERDVSTAVSQGRNPGPQVKAFVGRFGDVITKCGYGL